MSKSTATLSILVGASLWGCIGLFLAPLTAAGLSSMDAVTLRCGGATLVYFFYLLWKDPTALSIHLRHLPYFIGTGICSLLFFNWCYFNSIVESSLSVAVVLLYTAPAFVMVMSAILFKEQVTGIKLFALALTLVGCGLVAQFFPLGDALSPSALLFGVGSGFGYALYSILGRFALAKYSPATVTFYTFLLATVGAFPLSGIWTHTHLLTSPGVVGGTLGLSVVCCIFPYLLYTNGLQHTDPGRAAILATVEPFVGAVLGITMFSDPITPGKLWGMGAILISVVLLNLPSKK